MRVRNIAVAGSAIRHGRVAREASPRGEAASVAREDASRGEAASVARKEASREEVTSIASEEASPPTISMARRAASILFTPYGRGRPADLATLTTDGARVPRAWFDFMLTSHIAFAPAIFVGAANGVYDIAVLQTLVLGASLAYHRAREAPGRLARPYGAR